MAKEGASQAQVEVASRVCEGWHRFTLEDFRKAFTDDVVYRNMPLPDVVRGPDQIYETLRRVPLQFDVLLKIETLVARPDLVMVERTETFTRRDGKRPRFDLPVTGVFEFRGDRICAWRDYFDMRTFQGEAS
jgi:limonene-1,2-epoxide hydrolase